MALNFLVDHLVETYPAIVLTAAQADHIFDRDKDVEVTLNLLHNPEPYQTEWKIYKATVGSTSTFRWRDLFSSEDWRAFEQRSTVREVNEFKTETCANLAKIEQLPWFYTQDVHDALIRVDKVVAKRVWVIHELRRTIADMVAHEHWRDVYDSNEPVKWMADADRQMRSIRGGSDEKAQVDCLVAWSALARNKERNASLLQYGRFLSFACPNEWRDLWHTLKRVEPKQLAAISSVVLVPTKPMPQATGERHIQNESKDFFTQRLAELRELADKKEKEEYKQLEDDGERLKNDAALKCICNTLHEFKALDEIELEFKELHESNGKMVKSPKCRAFNDLYDQEEDHETSCRLALALTLKSLS